MCLPRRFWCCTPRFGVYFIAVVDILFAIATIVIAFMLPPVGGPTRRGVLKLLAVILAAINIAPACVVPGGPYFNQKWYLVPWIIVRGIYLIILLSLMLIVPLCFKDALLTWILNIGILLVVPDMPFFSEGKYNDIGPPILKKCYYIGTGASEIVLLTVFAVNLYHFLVVMSFLFILLEKEGLYERVNFECKLSRKHFSGI